MHNLPPVNDATEWNFTGLAKEHAVDKVERMNPCIEYPRAMHRSMHSWFATKSIVDTVSRTAGRLPTNARNFGEPRRSNGFLWPRIVTFISNRTIKRDRSIDESGHGAGRHNGTAVFERFLKRPSGADFSEGFSNGRLGTDLLAFLPSDCAQHLTLVSPVPVRCAENWDDLDRLLSESESECVLLDPGADGTTRLKVVERILEKHPSALFAAYTKVTPDNLKAVFALSKCGLRRAFVYPISGTDSPLIAFVERESYLRMSRIVDTLIEPTFSSLPPSLRHTIHDLFEKPGRYDAAKDIAREACLPTKSMYKQFARAGLISPKDLLILAKAVAGYGYLTLSDYSVRSISKKLGFADERTFVKHMAILGVDTHRRFDSDWDDVLVELKERLQKPRFVPAVRGTLKDRLLANRT
jgi:hypothetical protein